MLFTLGGCGNPDAAEHSASPQGPSEKPSGRSADVPQEDNAADRAASGQGGPRKSLCRMQAAVAASDGHAGYGRVDLRVAQVPDADGLRRAHVLNSQAAVFWEAQAERRRRQPRGMVSVALSLHWHCLSHAEAR